MQFCREVTSREQGHQLNVFSAVVNFGLILGDTQDKEGLSYSGPFHQEKSSGTCQDLNKLSHDIHNSNLSKTKK